MDYKYIEQLLERYWRCETSLEEEDILRAFFSQKDVPASLLQYKPLFAYQQEERKAECLGNDFDQKILAMTEKSEVVKARTITMRHRLAPLFKAAAIVAIILTLGNAMQVPFSEEQAAPQTDMAGFSRSVNGPSVAKADTVKADTLGKYSSEMPEAVIIK